MNNVSSNIASLRPLSLPEDQPALVRVLTGSVWPFHVTQCLAEDKAVQLIAEGAFSLPEAMCFLIIVSGNVCGFVRAYEIEDIELGGYPVIDIRLSHDYRGRGVGKIALRLACEEVFLRYPNLSRIGGSTRQDNWMMRTVFQRCGFAKEGHFRCDWPGDGKEFFDTVHFGLLRRDWESGSTTPVRWDDSREKECIRRLS